MAACAAPLVGWLARYEFGFSGTAAVGLDHAENLAKTRSLGSALLAFTAIPWTLCVLFFTPLHWTYPRDQCAQALAGAGPGAVGSVVALPLTERPATRS